MSSSSSRLTSCTHSAAPGTATLSLGIVAPIALHGATPLPRQYHIRLTRGQVDSITLGLQRIAQQLGGAEEEE